MPPEGSSQELAAFFERTVVARFVGALAVCVFAADFLDVDLLVAMFPLIVWLHYGKLRAVWQGGKYAKRPHIVAGRPAYYCGHRTACAGLLKGFRERML